MSEGYVCHVNEKIEGAVYIGRANGRAGLKAGPLANPHKITELDDRGMVVANFLVDLFFGVAHGNRKIIDGLIAARGKPLACWCRKSTDESPLCHGDAILEFLAEHDDETIRRFIKEKTN